MPDLDLEPHQYRRNGTYRCMTTLATPLGVLTALIVAIPFLARRCCAASRAACGSFASRNLSGKTIVAVTLHRGVLAAARCKAHRQARVSCAVSRGSAAASLTPNRGGSIGYCCPEDPDLTSRVKS